MNRTLQGIFSAIRRTGDPAIYNPGTNTLLALIEIELERHDCLAHCDGVIYTNDKILVDSTVSYKLRGRDGKAAKTVFFNDSDSVIVIREEGFIIAILAPHTSYSPPFGGAGELYAKASMSNAKLLVSTQRYCDCGDAPTYIDSEPIGSFLL